MEITKVVKPFIRRGWPNTFGNMVYVYKYNHVRFLLFRFLVGIAFVLTLVEAGKSIRTWCIVTFIYIYTLDVFSGGFLWSSPSGRSFAKTMSNLVNIVSPHQRSRLLCLPILLVLLFLRSPAMTWSRVTHQPTEMAFSSSPTNRIKVFHEHKNDTNWGAHCSA